MKTRQYQHIRVHPSRTESTRIYYTIVQQTRRHPLDIMPSKPLHTLQAPQSSTVCKYHHVPSPPLRRTSWSRATHPPNQFPTQSPPIPTNSINSEPNSRLKYPAFSPFTGISPMLVSRPIGKPQPTHYYFKDWGSTYHALKFAPTPHGTACQMTGDRVYH